MTPCPKKKLSIGAIHSLMALCLLLTGPPARAQNDLPEDLTGDERNTIGVFREASESVVYITNNAYRRSRFSRNVFEVPLGSGSGFVWDRDGHIVTNFHVVQDGDHFLVTLFDGTSLDAELAGVDEFKDIAVLKLAEGHPNLKPIERGDSRHLLVGQKVIAIGNPFGLDQTLTTGVISALRREMQSVRNTTITDVIQTDASINPGNSGGPLLDSRGRLIGVNTAIYSTSGSSAGIGFAVPIAPVERIVPQLIRYGEVKRVGLGITVFADDYSKRWGVNGLVVEKILRNGAADRAGIQPSYFDQHNRFRLGDVIVSIDGRPVSDFDDLFQAFEGRKDGDEVRLGVVREGKEKELRANLQAIN